MRQYPESVTKVHMPPVEEASAPQPVANRAMPRLVSLDILRALAILGMGLSGRVPWGTLPAWMYHAQTPPPSMKLDPTVFGITWVDLVFPFFLFAMGAAMPLALGKRMEAGASTARLAWDIGKRGVWLGLFAIVAQQLRPDSTGPSWGLDVWSMAIISFIAMVMAWGVWPKSWPRPLGIALQVLGVGVLLLAGSSFLLNGGQGWQWNRVDIILMVLANVAVSGGCIWLLTRNRPAWRWGAIALVAGLFLAKSEPGVLQQFWKDWAWSPWIVPEYHKYLLLTLPGTFAGEAVLKWSRERASKPEDSAPSAPMQLLLFGVGPALCVIACMGLLARDWVWTVGCTLPLLALGGWVVGKVSRTLAPLAHFGTLFLILGLVVEPLGGGIRKDPTTFSYFFVTAGLAFWLLLSLLALEPKPLATPSDGASPPEKRRDLLQRVVRSPIDLLAGAGANPMIAYIAITNFVPAAMRLSGVHGWANDQGWDPWGYAAYAGVQTLLVALVAWALTRARIFMRT